MLFSRIFEHYPKRVCFCGMETHYGKQTRAGSKKASAHYRPKKTVMHNASRCFTVFCTCFFARRVKLDRRRWNGAVLRPARFWRCSFAAFELPIPYLLLCVFELPIPYSCPVSVNFLSRSAFSLALAKTIRNNKVFASLSVRERGNRTDLALVARAVNAESRVPSLAAMSGIWA